MKPEKYEKLRDAVEEHIAAHYMRNRHALRFSDIREAFPDEKKKNLKQAWEDLV